MTPLGRPWFLHLGPFVAPYAARLELDRLSEGLSEAEYIRAIWRLRIGDKPVKRHRSRAWPATCRQPNKGPFCLPQPKNNVTPLKRVAKP